MGSFLSPLTLVSFFSTEPGHGYCEMEGTRGELLNSFDVRYNLFCYLTMDSGSHSLHYLFLFALFEREDDENESVGHSMVT